MTEENKNIDVSDVVEETENTTALAEVPVNLNEESLAIINKLIAETDESKTRDLTQLFNANQNKKTMVRVNKLSDLLDTITDQALARFTARPDEISNKELFDGLKVVQDLIERGQKQVSGVGEMPLIQLNQQNNEVNFGDPSSSLNRESRERVKTAVLGLLDSLSKKPADIVEAQDADIVEVTEVENTEGEAND